MFIRDLNDRPEFLSGDRAALRELLHGEKDGLALRYSLAHATVRPGRRTLPHRLKTSEVYYVLEGRGRMTVDAESADVSAGQAVYIPPGAVQSISNPGPGELVFLCIVDPAWRPEDEEILGP
jgi:mannose-6-phosphate isomerase-like protein (cupin superfamily)